MVAEQQAGSVPAEAVARALRAGIGVRAADDAWTIAVLTARVEQLETELTDARAQRPSEEPAK